MQETPTVQQPIPPQQPPMYPPPTYQPPQKPPRSRKRLWLILGIIAAVILVLGIIGSNIGTKEQTTTTPQATQPAQQATTQPSQPTATQPSQPTVTVTPTPVPTWKTTQTFTGNGIKTTAVFHLSESAKLLWSGDPSSSYGGEYNLIVTLYNSDGTISDLPINTIVKDGNVSGDTMVQNHGGDVYLQVISEGSWKITIQELQ